MDKALRVDLDAEGFLLQHGPPIAGALVATYLMTTATLARTQVPGKVLRKAI